MPPISFFSHCPLDDFHYEPLRHEHVGPLVNTMMADPEGFKQYDPPSVRYHPQEVERQLNESLHAIASRPDIIAAVAADNRDRARAFAMIMPGDGKINDFSIYTAPALRKHGVSEQLSRDVIGKAFREQNLERIVACYEPSNEGSAKLQNKLGFVSHTEPLDQNFAAYIQSVATDHGVNVLPTSLSRKAWEAQAPGKIQNDDGSWSLLA